VYSLVSIYLFYPKGDSINSAWWGSMFRDANATKQSKSQTRAVAHFTAEPGKVYYFAVNSAKTANGEVSQDRHAIQVENACRKSRGLIA
jgi:hypothetical protein